jgi:hypothetical protein
MQYGKNGSLPPSGSDLKQSGIDEVRRDAVNA